MIVPADGVLRAGMDPGHLVGTADEAQTGPLETTWPGAARAGMKATARHAPAAVVAVEIFGGTTAIAAATVNTRSVASLPCLCRKLP